MKVCENGTSLFFNFKKFTKGVPILYTWYIQMGKGVGPRVVTLSVYNL